jgi:hypothetical protein
MAGTKLVLVLEFDLASLDDVEPFIQLAVDEVSTLRDLAGLPAPCYIAINESADRVLEVLK